MFKFNNKWDVLLKEEFKKNYYLNLIKFLKKEYENKKIFPPKKHIYRALKYVDTTNCKVVILGQDPYHGENQADGLAFSVPKNVKPPPSLLNILKETEKDLNIKQPKNFGNLEKWAKQGVLLLNSILTVEKSKPKSHSKIGWEILTNKIISILNYSSKPIVFILWGNSAIHKEKLILNKKHLILKAPHPSPLSCFRGFFGCNHFSKANYFLLKTNNTIIDWKLLS